MTTFTVGKSSHNKNDIKNASLAMKSRQQVINEVNKRRTLLQDNSWIKKRPEEESTNENYGRVVLNQYKSQDSLNRNLEGKDDEKSLLNRYRSDTTLDRSQNVKAIGDKNEGYQDLDDLIKVDHTSKWQGKGCDLDSLTAVKDNREDRSSDLETLIAIKTKTVEGHQDLDDFIVVNCTLEQHDKSERNQDLEDFIKVNCISNQKGTDCELDSFIEVKGKSNQGSSKQSCESESIPRNQSDMSHLTQVSGGTRAIIEKELCTYCRKPLGTETKMILKALQICCHATCFKCEVCKATLENLKAGDSIWIYKNTVHCSPCYSKVKATWTY